MDFVDLSLERPGVDLRSLVHLKEGNIVCRKPLVAFVPSQVKDEHEAPPLCVQVSPQLTSRSGRLA